MTNHKNYLFILANQGAGGHRLGRMISKLDNVYWYSCNKNGLTPDDLFLNPSNAVGPDRVTGKDISIYHYDRIIGDAIVPLVGERIEVYWNSTDLDYYYNTVWSTQMKPFSAFLENVYLHWVLHDCPDVLIRRFTNAKIISLIDIDIDLVIDRYLKTTAQFPCYYRLRSLRPSYHNQHSLDVDNLEKIKPGATLQDLWQYQHPGKNYESFVKNKLINDNAERSNYHHPRHLKVTWNNVDLDQIYDFLKN